MPTYSYKCTECGYTFDTQQSFADASLTTCPECGGVLRKVFGNLGVTFNGSGFYRTDSRPSHDGTGTSSGTSSDSSAGSTPPATPSSGSSSSAET